MKKTKEEKFDLFQNKVIEAVSSYYGEEYEVDVKLIQKLNGIQLHGLNILKKGSIMCPTIYLEDFFERYERGTAFSVVFRDIIEVYENHKNTEFKTLEFFSDYDRVKKYLSIKLINADYNCQILEDVPHVKINDLAVVCIVEVINSQIDMGSVLIHNNHICMWGVKASQLVEDAINNAMINNPAHLRKLTEIVMNMYCEEAEFKEETYNKEKYTGVISKHEIMQCSREPENMFVLSNKRQMFGAGTIMYPGILEEIAEALKTDFYILPSSIHEVIILPAKICSNAESINEMICSINKEMLSREEILSNHAYLYQISNNSLISLSDTDLYNEES